LGLEKIVEQGIDTMTPYIALGTSDNSNATNYTYASTHEFYDNSESDNTNPSYCECTLTSDGYTTLGKAATVVVNLDAANTRIELVITDLIWTLLGNASSPNETVTCAWLYDYTGTPTTSPLLAYFSVGNVVTTNQDFTLDFDATNGNIQIPYTIA